MITLYGLSASGNCYKLQLACAQLGIEHAWEEIDVTRGENLSPEFLALNDRGKVPVLRLEDGRTLSESNAILNYLAQGTRLLPDDHWGRAKTLQWMFFEQYSHEPCIAVSRFIRKYLPAQHPRRASLEALQASGNEALAAMERHLARLPWFGGETYTIADIALFAYTHVADEAGFDLGAYPRVEHWLKRVMQQPGFVPMRND
ncbi:glutathione S-transferase family protein [Thermomonas sp.]|jgi:glutathione S-transferase|uniref:glutathione S-transferase family protein n=1 Tax=Thermomonas sp. TaxID=1971895 RepID=UPI001B5509D9|nr:glutathione S-transferase family protein [Thermomonas sp.]MBK6334162.1 glutathione S-transferase family protein [Thermomonas sp.]MBK6415729.1 glutathione S-transferase family protein [Thermomonas sp.]MBK6924888.1 glutathione S-transferase family protein [Thermomonas sp.]MBK7206511.1 glutathione S-transferase family protein [Thermomonas sp.]MBL0229100.1 glutathione S-transferase family protein [Thermomonas sp.]